MMPDVTATFRGVTTPVHELNRLIEEQGWEPGKVSHGKGGYSASASFAGEKIEKTGPDQATAVSNVLKAILRKHHMRSAVQEHLGMGPPQYLDRLDEIAQEYANASAYDPKAAPFWKELADDSLRRADVLADQVAIEYTNDPFPYKTAQELREDVQDKQKLLVTTANSDHPLWTLDQVLAFRAVHDVMGYAVAGADFGWHGENLAFEAHSKLLSHTAQQALFTETIGQVAATTFFGSLPQVKVVALEAFGEQRPKPARHPSQTVAPSRHVHASNPHDRQPGDQCLFEYRCFESHESEDADLWYRSHQPVTVVGTSVPGAAGANTIEERGNVGEPRYYRVRFADGSEYDAWEDELKDSPAEFDRPDPPGQRTAATALADPNAGWSSGIQPDPQNAYLWHGDPLEAQNVMENAQKVDTGWSGFKREDGTPDLDRMKQAIVNAFRVTLLSPRKDLRWNAVHYQDISGVPSGVTDPKVYWDTLEKKRRDWNQAQGYDPDAHMIYYKFLKPFESILLQREPQLGYEGAHEKAQSIMYEWWAQEQQRVEQEDKDKPPEKQRPADEVERRANEALARRLQTYVKDQYDPKLDERSHAEQPSLFAKVAITGVPVGMRCIKCGSDELYDDEGDIRCHVCGTIQKNSRWRAEAAGEQYNMLTGEGAGKYGSWMGSHLKAIAKISQHVDEIAQAALQDVQEHDGTGHHFRAAVLQLGVPGVGPKVCSFTWLLLQPMTSQLATIDTHMMDVLGHDYAKEMNNRDYFKFERELQAGRDSAGYGHVPLGAFQWGMWDYKRTGPGSHQDHSAMRALDPVPHQQVDWASKALNLKGEDWAKQAPEWWQQTQPYREQVSNDWDQNVAPTTPRNGLPFQTYDPDTTRLGRAAPSGPTPWYSSPEGSVWTGLPGQSYARLISQVHGMPAHEYWQMENPGAMGKYWPEDDRLVVATGQVDEPTVRGYLRDVLSPSDGPTQQTWPLT